MKAHCNMMCSSLHFDELDSLGSGNVSPRTMLALQKCDVLDKVALHVVGDPPQLAIQFTTS